MSIGEAHFLHGFLAGNLRGGQRVEHFRIQYRLKFHTDLQRVTIRNLEVFLLSVVCEFELIVGHRYQVLSKWLQPKVLGLARDRRKYHSVGV